MTCDLGVLNCFSSLELVDLCSFLKNRRLDQGPLLSESEDDEVFFLRFEDFLPLRCFHCMFGQYEPPDDGGGDDEAAVADHRATWLNFFINCAVNNCATGFMNFSSRMRVFMVA